MSASLEESIRNEIDIIFKKLDLDENNLLTIKEFKGYFLEKLKLGEYGKLSRKQRKSLKRHAKQLFSQCDQDGNNIITKGELEKYLIEMAHQEQDVLKQFETLMEKMDKDKDNFLNLEEFTQMYTDYFKALYGVDEDRFARMKKEAQSCAKQLFKRYDFNEDKKLSREEIITYLKEN